MGVRLVDYAREKNLIPQKIELDVAIASTGLEDPKIVEILTYVNTFYNADSLPDNIEGAQKSTRNQNDGLVFQTSLFYDKINPEKPMESGATAITGIRDCDLKNANLFKDSKFVNVLERAKKYDNVILRFANNYALDLVSKELRDCGHEPLLTYNPIHMEFKVIDKPKIYVLEDLAMRYLDDRIPSFSLNNISKAMENKYDVELQDRIVDELARKYSSDTTPNVNNLARNLGASKGIIDCFNAHHYESIQYDFTKDNYPLRTFPFKAVGKKSIKTISDVSLPHLFSVFSKMKDNSGVAMVATVKDALRKKYPRMDFKDTLLDFFTEAKQLGMFDESSLDSYSKMFVRTFKTVENDFISSGAVKQNPTLDVLTKIRNQPTI